jgi:alkylation response protein AidB-like acyl-CoA dehydrogenase/predicted heme/steroid binding protein
MGDEMVSADELSKHNSRDDNWVQIDDKIYDLSKFAEYHPGGAHALLRNAGKDATTEFHSLHKPWVLEKYSNLAVGTLEGFEGKTASVRTDHISTGEKFGNTDVLYAEPYWYYGAPQPYYDESHAKLRRHIRNWVDEHFNESAINQMDDSGTFPDHLLEASAKAGLNHLNCRYCLAPLVKQGLIKAPNLPDGLDFTELDDFHDLIVVDELARCAAGGVLAGVFVSLAIALPCIIMAGSDEIKARVVEDALAGKKRMCLAITEPYGGSDVASVKTSAVKATDENGEHYIVNGEKKFITGGCSADFLVVAVRTSDNGYFGISLLLLEKGMPGLDARRMKTQGWNSSATAFLTFDNVRSGHMQWSYAQQRQAR